MHKKMLTDFVSKKFFVLFIRHFAIERSWNFLNKKPIWFLYLRFSFAWNHEGAHIVYSWQSADLYEDVMYVGIGYKE